MKKMSTAAGKTIKNFHDQKLTTGFDLGDRSSWYCVLDEAGEVLPCRKLAPSVRGFECNGDLSPARPRTSPTECRNP
jgi:transposase